MKAPFDPRIEGRFWVIAGLIVFQWCIDIGLLLAIAGHAPR